MHQHICAEMVSTIIEVQVDHGTLVAEGDTVALLESMKMEIPLVAEVSGRVVSITAAVGSVVQADDVVLTLDVRAGS